MRILGRILQRSEEIVASSLLLLLCVTVAAQVFSRFILKNPFTWADEVARLLFLWTAFIGAAVALKQNRHFAIDLLAARLEKSGGMLSTSALWSRRLAATVVILLLCILVWYGFAHTWRVRGTTTDILEISMAWVYLPLPLSCLSMILRSMPMVLSAPAESTTAGSSDAKPD